MRTLISLLIFVIVLPNAAWSGVLPKKPKLVILIVIDQFRADYLTRFESRFLPARGKNGEVGGFRYLMSSGAYYPFAQYDLLQAMTGPGHATTLTGALPYQMGIPENYWFDAKTNEYVYCAEDRSSKTIGVPEDSWSVHLGTSPKHLIGTTVGDELKNAGFPSRVVSVALKDRAAILMGGHRADLALWYDGKTNRWVSSNYYLRDGKLPGWVNALNQKIKLKMGEKLVWQKPVSETGLSASDALVREGAPIEPKIGKAFPHSAPLGSRQSLLLPLGYELTEAAAEKALDAFKLGRGKSTDLFAVSFSSHDYLGHAFGPNSLEMEEITLVGDRMISKLLNHIRKHVPGGLRDVVIALTADHGAPANPDWLKAHQVPAGRIDEAKIVETLSAQFDKKYGKLDEKEKWFPFAHDFNFFLNRKAIRARELDLAKIEAEAKAYIAELPGVAHVFTSSEYAARRLPPGLHERQILNTYFPGRSGDLIIIPKPFFIPVDDDLVSHLTGYSYDRTVPLVISGPFVRSGTYSTRAGVIDLAPTLSFLLGVLPPSSSEGRVLSEALRGF